jgi:hypothetical protein
VVYDRALAAQQNFQAAITVPRLLLRQRCEFLRQRAVPFFVPFVTERRSGNVGQLAGFALGRGECFNQKRRVRTPVYELNPVFISSAFNISRSRQTSATSFFSRLFSSSRCRSRVASFRSMPPYLAFQA